MNRINTEKGTINLHKHKITFTYALVCLGKLKEFNIRLECSYSQAIPFEAWIDFTAILNSFKQVFQTFQENYRKHVNSIN